MVNRYRPFKKTIIFTFFGNLLQNLNLRNMFVFFRRVGVTLFTGSILYYNRSFLFLVGQQGIFFLRGYLSQIRQSPPLEGISSSSQVVVRPLDLNIPSLGSNLLDFLRNIDLSFVNFNDMNIVLFDLASF